MRESEVGPFPAEDVAPAVGIAAGDVALVHSDEKLGTAHQDSIAACAVHFARIAGRGQHVRAALAAVEPRDGPSDDPQGRHVEVGARGDPVRLLEGEISLVAGGGGSKAGPSAA